MNRRPLGGVPVLRLGQRHARWQAFGRGGALLRGRAQEMPSVLHAHVGESRLAHAALHRAPRLEAFYPACFEWAVEQASEEMEPQAVGDHVAAEQNVLD